MPTTNRKKALFPRSCVEIKIFSVPATHKVTLAIIGQQASSELLEKYETLVSEPNMQLP